MNFCEDYKHFISVGKTERICVKEALKIAEATLKVTSTLSLYTIILSMY